MLAWPTSLIHCLAHTLKPPPPVFSHLVLDHLALIDVRLLGQRPCFVGHSCNSSAAAAGHREVLGGMFVYD